jgi:hypothetical protein
MNFFDPTPSLAKYFSKKFEECKKKRLGLDSATTLPGGALLSSDKFGSVRVKVKKKEGKKFLFALVEKELVWNHESRYCGPSGSFA